MGILTIKGKKCPVKFGATALGKIQDLIGAETLEELGKIQNLNAGKWADFIMAGLETGALIKKKEVPSIEDVRLAVDMDMSLFFEAMKIFQDDIQSFAPKKEDEQEGN